MFFAIFTVVVVFLDGITEGPYYIRIVDGVSFIQLGLLLFWISTGLFLQLHVGVFVHVWYFIYT